jgi:hypothetical protein
MERSQVYMAIDQERVYQDAKWGDLDSRNSLGDFLIYLGHRLDAARNHYHGPGNEHESLKYVQQVAAVAVAVLEKFGAPSRVRGVGREGNMTKSGSETFIEVLSAPDPELANVDKAELGDWVARYLP